MDNITDNLTNEKISKNFTNQFDLVSYAITLATDMIRTGRQPRVDMDTENPALLVLEEISEGKDTFEESPSCEETELSFTEDEIVEEIVEIEEETQEVLSE